MEKIKGFLFAVRHREILMTDLGLTQMLGVFSTNLFVCCKYANYWDELLSVWLLASYAIFKSQTKSKSKVFGAKTPFVVQKKTFYMMQIGQL